MYFWLVLYLHLELAGEKCFRGIIKKTKQVKSALPNNTLISTLASEYTTARKENTQNETPALKYFQMEVILIVPKLGKQVKWTHLNSRR